MTDDEQRQHDEQTAKADQQAAKAHQAATAGAGLPAPGQPSDQLQKAHTALVDRVDKIVYALKHKHGINLDNSPHTGAPVDTNTNATPDPNAT